MAKFTRRHLLMLASGAALFGGARFGHSRLSRQAAPAGPLSPEAKALVDRAWRGLDPKQVLDAHVHVVGMGTGGTGCRVAERMTSPTNPVEYFKYTVYLNASGVTDLTKVDQQYIDTLSGLIRAQRPHGRALILAFDQAYGDDGRPLEALTEFYTPNEYVLKLASYAPDLFVPCASVHPYRADALKALEGAVAGGAVAVKWLPNAMNIDPSSPKCDAFYDAMVKLKVPLLTHAGEEKAVHAADLQRLGNPLLLRRPLERGVKVIVAHCASLGQNPDLDAPGQPMVDNFDLFMRLLRDPTWERSLFGEISALTLINRVGRPLRTMLQEQALHSRLISGSDYPLPAINALMQTRAIVSEGFLTEEERGWLNELDRHDPLLFDFVMKRTLRLRDGGQALGFADHVFMARREVFPLLFA